jgi:glutamate-1-semialdehyde-2,1-aminomutase
MDKMAKQYAKSQALLARARKVTPLGSQTYSKSVRYFCEGAAPAFLDRGMGSHVWDVDGNEFVDFMCALGPVTVGYNDPQVNAAVMAQLQKGISFSMATELEVELAEALTRIVPCAEMVRFVKNGSDATSSAIRLARAFTGRDLVAVCGYHGMQDWYIGSTTNRRGIPDDVCALTKTFAYNDPDSLKKLLAEYPGQFAAVILEPIQADGPADGYLAALRELTQAAGALLVFDEVVSGFRYALGGASELYKVTPDLAAFGKGMGNGLPISAVAGRADVMELIGTQGVFISTTFGGETLSMAGSMATLAILAQPGIYPRIWALGDRMLSGVRAAIAKHGVGEVVKVSGLAPHGGVGFDGKGSLDYLDIQSVYQQRMVEQGILTTGINNISVAHSEADIDQFVAAADAAFADIRRALDADSLDGILLACKVNPIFKRNK